MKRQRNTKQKQMVLDTVRARCDHPTADQIFMDIRAQDSRISRGTVYRNLSQLSESGEINHVKVPGADRFDRRTELHCHLICMGCARVSDALVGYDEAVDEALAKQSGYIISRHRTVFEGYCPACRKKLAKTEAK